MEFTPVQNLPCLGPDDYAAYATYMQCLAETLEDKFTTVNDALMGVRNTYAGVWRNTSPLVSDGSGFFPTVMSTASLFWNDPDNAPVTGTGTTNDPVRFQFPGMVPGGLYEVGGTVLFNQGATANSSRQFQMSTYFQATTGIVQGLIANDFTEESLTGGEGLRGDAHLGLTSRELAPSSGNFGIPIGFLVSLAEADAGTITVATGNLTFWAVLIGTNTLIGGV